MTPTTAFAYKIISFLLIEPQDPENFLFTCKKDHNLRFTEVSYVLCVVYFAHGALITHTCILFLYYVVSHPGEKNFEKWLLILFDSGLQSSVTVLIHDRLCYMQIAFIVRLYSYILILDENNITHTEHLFHNN